MAKDPAFLFYSGDFLVGVMTLNFEDRGKYITLLSLMHQQGRMSEETIRLLVGSVSVNLKSKFSVDNNGLWFNERLESESEKRAKFTESRRNNGALGGRPKDKKNKPKGKPKHNHKVNLMEDENKDKDKDVIKEVIEYLNKTCEKKYGVKTKAYVEYINARLSEGRTLEDFKYVIEVKAEEWKGDPANDKYLNPETLFRPSHFEKYLNQKKNSELKTAPKFNPVTPLSDLPEIY